MDSKHLIGKRSEDMRRKEELAARPQFLLRGFLPLLLTSTLLQLNIPPIFEMFIIFQIFIFHIHPHSPHFDLNILKWKILNISNIYILYWGLRFLKPSLSY